MKYKDLLGSRIFMNILPTISKLRGRFINIVYIFIYYFVQSIYKYQQTFPRYKTAMLSQYFLKTNKTLFQDFVIFAYLFKDSP